MDAGGDWWRCVARSDGAAVTAWRELDDAPAAPAGPLLTLPPAGACYVHAVLRAADGSIVGMLSYDTC
jgi:hypothetical protein